MNIHIEYQEPLRPPKAHKVDAPEATSTNVDIEKHLVDNEDKQKQQQQSGQQQQSRQDSVEAKLLASIQEILKKPIFAGNLSTQSIEVLGTIFEKLHDLESNIKIREQIRRLLQELANSSIEELNLLEKKIKQLISSELLRVVPASSTAHQADKMTLKLLNHLSVNDFSSARDTTTLLNSFLKSPSSQSYTPSTQFGNTLVQQLQDAIAFNNQKLNVPELKEISVEFKQRLSQPITPQQFQQLSAVMQKTQSPFLLAHVTSTNDATTTLSVEGQKLTIPQNLGFKTGEAFLLETTQKNSKPGIYIHPITRDASPQTLKMFSKTEIPIENLLKIYAQKNSPEKVEAAITQNLMSKKSSVVLPQTIQSTERVPLTSQALIESPQKPSLLQALSPTPRVIENISFMNQFQELFQKTDLRVLHAVSQSFYNAETMMGYGETIKPSQEELLFKLLLANNLELPEPKAIERILQYDTFKGNDRNLLPQTAQNVLQQLQQQVPNRPMTAFETLHILQQIQDSSDTMREHAALRTVIEHVQTNVFDQNTSDQQNQQTMYWMHQNNLHKGRVSVKDERERDESGNPKDGPIGFILETQTPNLGDVSINFKLDKEKVDLVLLDSHGTHGAIVNEGRESLAREFSSLGWELMTLDYGLLAGKDSNPAIQKNYNKPFGADGIDLQA